MNKRSKIKHGFIYFFIFAIFVGVFSLVNYYEFRKYQSTYNDKLNYLCSQIVKEHPEITDSEPMELLNDQGNAESNFFQKYGIKLDEDSVIRENDKLYVRFLAIEVILLVLGFLVVGVAIIIISRIRDREIHKILKYIEQINDGNYKLKIDDNEEGELSILKNEVYKTTIMLKEAADNSLKDKIAIKDSLSDISHQLKTPITSLLINLENIEDNLDGEKELLERLISNSRRDTNSISKLVKNMLELSKFDSNTIEYIRKDVDLSDIVKNASQKVEALADLLDISIEIEGTQERQLTCDAYWQTEAVANLLKNAVEHATSYVKVTYECNKVYAKVEVENDGETISEKDRLHIFERFYKGENATKDSLGIGLSMVKAIVEKDGGYVTVDSYNNKTIFTIKYL